MLWALAPYSLDRKTGKVGTLKSPDYGTRVKGWQNKLASVPGIGHNAYKNVKKYIPEDYFKFAFVRNPFQALYSSWARHLETKNYPYTDTFREYLILVSRKKIARVHTRWTQWDYLSYDGEIAMDFVGRFENLQDDWAHITKTIGLEGLELPKLNQNEEKDTSLYREAYTPRMRKFVENRYRKDLEVFGYEF